MTPHKTSKTLYDLNYLLQVANVLICGLSIYLYYIKDENDFVNIFTLLLLSLIAIENIGMLAYEKRKRNPFIIILVILVTVFYMARIATILHIPASASLYEIELITRANDYNYALWFILLCNASMFLGFYIGGKNANICSYTTCSDDCFPKIYSAIIIIVLLGLVNFFAIIDVEIFGRLTGYIRGVFFSQHIILLFTLTFLIFYYNNISQRIIVLFVVIMLIFGILLSLFGSRAAVLTIGMLLVKGILAVKQRVLISKKILLICFILIPISLFLFVTATFLKQQLREAKTVTAEHVYVLKEQNLLGINHLEAMLPLIYYRLGFLDWSTELIANEQEFRQVINVQYYIKSIIDNVLTPGFNIFDTVMASHTLSYIKRGQSLPDHDQITKDYQSDQMGIYGEYYVLFYGYPALIVFFFLAFIFQRIYLTLNNKDGLLSCMYRAILLYLFYWWLNSFGVDWFIYYVVSAVITTFLFARFYVSKRKRKIVLGIEPKKETDNMKFAT